MISGSPFRHNNGMPVKLHSSMIYKHQVKSAERANDIASKVKLVSEVAKAQQQ